MFSVKVDLPPWARRRLDISKKLYGQSAWAVVWGGKFGPKVEPYFSEVKGQDLENEGGILWTEFVPSGLTIDSCHLKLADNHVTLAADSPQDLTDLINGNLRFKNGSIKPLQLAIISSLKGNFPALKFEFDESRTDIAQTPEAIVAEMKRKKVAKKRSQAHSFGKCEQEAIERVRTWHQSNKADILWVTLPAIDSTQPKDPWTAKDEAFRGWLAHQSRALVYSPDDVTPEIRNIVNIQTGDQKPTHQGWEIWQHALLSTILMNTDNLPHKFVRAMRVGMLLHDIGKTDPEAMLATGTHGGYGAKIWQKARPEWLTDREADIVTNVIRNHDLLGLMDRAIKDPHLAGTLSPAQVRKRIEQMPVSNETALRMACALNDADLGSVSSLRYYLPLTPVLVDVIKAKPFDEDPHKDNGHSL